VLRWFPKNHVQVRERNQISSVTLISAFKSINANSPPIPADGDDSDNLYSFDKKVIGLNLH
jgi:hypothetical protein